MHHAMVDKVWYDWQLKHKANQYAYEGGSVEEIDSLADYEKYPNGGPPFLGVSKTNSPVTLTDGFLARLV
jgi:tyrosinase